MVARAEAQGEAEAAASEPGTSGLAESGGMAAALAWEAVPVALG